MPVLSNVEGGPVSPQMDTDKITPLLCKEGPRVVDSPPSPKEVRGDLSVSICVHLWLNPPPLLHPPLGKGRNILFAPRGAVCVHLWLIMLKSFGVNLKTF